MGTIELLSQAVDSIVDAKLAAYKAAIAQLITPGFNLFNLVQIAGSEAKSHYGFKLFDANKQVRDLDVVIKYKAADRSIYEVLQASSDKLVTGYTGDNSSVPVHFTSEQKFKPALYRFAYPYKGVMRWVEVFEAQADTPQWEEFVPLKQLIDCAIEWKREKDNHFLKQVFVLTAGLKAPENKEQIAYNEFLLVNPLNSDTENTKATLQNINTLSVMIGIDRSELREALQEAHDVTWICPQQQKLTVGEVKYLKRIFNKE